MNNFKKRINGLFNKYTLLLLFTYFVFGTGFSYAYFAFVEEDTSTIVGNVIAIDADLTVERVVGTNTKMVPMLNGALSNALNNVGGTSACVDLNGNLSCQVYKITLTNNGSRLQNVKGSINLYAKSGTNNAYSNLKWQELTNTTTVKTDSNVHGMTKSTLVSNLTLETNESKEWYIAVWIGEIDVDQTNTDKGQFGGTITFEASEDIGTLFVDKKLVPVAVSDKDIAFNKSSKESGTNGVYVRNGTENDTNPIYYYRGNVTNNNLIFADVCWKIVRTTETGGLKLIYNGEQTNGGCNNTGTASQIGTKQFNNSYNSPAYVGYMYSDVYTYSTKGMTSITDSYYYANDVSYQDGVYTLINTTDANMIQSPGTEWANIYNGGLNNNHYTCFTTGTTCEKVYYIYFTSNSTAYYITLENGKKVEDALIEMLGADDQNTANYNKKSSVIKGNNTTEGTIDYWYYENIEQKGYNTYLEDTVWCNDRTIANKAGWNPDGGSTTTNLTFSANNRIYTTYSPNLSCSRKIDSFTADDEVNGNGNLDYPVGLLTADEIMLAGGRNTNNDSYYLYTGENWWAGSPSYFDNYFADGFSVGYSGTLYGSLVNASFGVRPSVSLKPGYLISGGQGTVDNPYIVE